MEIASVTTSYSYLSMKQAARLFPPSRGDVPVHPATLTRWIISGARTADGARIRLKAIRVPSGWKTTEEDVEAFLAALTGAALGETDVQHEITVTPTSSRLRELAKVDTQLDAIGI
jgi:hypothetical protein